MKPIIGITMYYEKKPKKDYSLLSQHYMRSVNLAGGVPVLIPNGVSADEVDTYLDMIDGLLLSGGEDVAPFTYGEDPIKEVTYINPERDYFEIALVKRAVERNVPILGICRGMQILNVALGGSLYQDIHKQLVDEIGHMPMEMPVDQLYHKIEIYEDTILYNIFKEKEMLVNSFHHQAVKELGEGLVATAYAGDGIIEGIEYKGKKNIIGFQSHPEDLTVAYPKFIALFKYLIDQC